MAATKAWDLEPDNVINVLDGGKSEDNLIVLMDKLTWWCGNSDFWQLPQLKDGDYITFREPDINDEFTGFAIKPGCNPKWITELPLIFKIGGEIK